MRFDSYFEVWTGTRLRFSTVRESGTGGAVEFAQLIYRATKVAPEIVEIDRRARNARLAAA